MEIRMLGPVQVRRADGSIVEPAEWRTAKTLDLLRLLALSTGEPVPVASVVDKLWPDVDETRGKASLRTAASQLRRAIGENCIDRRAGGLVLLGAWVDVQVYEALLDDAEGKRRSGDQARTVAIAREAEALYLGDLDAPDASGDWLYEARDRLRRRRCRALLDAAEAAASLCWMRDSLELAERAAGLDMCEETARALMRALAGVGEIEKALEVFDRTRRGLASRYGVDPSPQTRALHLQLLTGTAARNRSVGLVGHAEAVDTLAGILSGMLRGGSRAGGVVWLQGEAGSGRDSVAAAACSQAGLSLHDAGRDAWLHDRRDLPVAAWDIPETDVVVMPHADTVPQHALRVLDTLARRHGGVLVVPVSRAPEAHGGQGRARFELPQRVVALEPLPDAALMELAELVLQGPVSVRLLRCLRAESGGLSGVACTVAHRWLSEGRIVWTVEGLELSSSVLGQRIGVSASLRRSLRLLPGHAEDVVNVLAVAGGEVAEEQVGDVVAKLHGSGSGEVHAVLEQLVHSGHVVLNPEGYSLRERQAGTEILASLRPQHRQRLHQLVAEHLSLEVPQRVRMLGTGAQRTREIRSGRTSPQPGRVHAGQLRTAR